MSTDKGRILIPIARAAIGSRLGIAIHADESAPWLQDYGASFVTLTQCGQLRGCIGSLLATRPLLEDLKKNAVAAAFHDPRFPPLTPREFEITQAEVSLLSVPQPMSFQCESDALQQLHPGVDGVIFQCGEHCSTFLPQVWEQLPDPQAFMAHLKQKAGLSPLFWNEAVKLSCYTVQKWKQQDYEANTE